MSNEVSEVTEVPPFVRQTKEWRKQLDEILQRIKVGSTPSISPNDPILFRTSRERSLAITKLEESIMWLGMDLKAQNVPTPYPNSYNPDSPIIDKTADGLKL